MLEEESNEMQKEADNSHLFENECAARPLNPALPEADNWTSPDKRSTSDVPEEKTILLHYK